MFVEPLGLRRLNLRRPFCRSAICDLMPILGLRGCSFRVNLNEEVEGIPSNSWVGMAKAKKYTRLSLCALVRRPGSPQTHLYFLPSTFFLAGSRAF